MKLFCTNPGCEQSVHTYKLRFGLPGSGLKKDGQWFCSQKCFNHYISGQYIQDKRCGLKKRVRHIKLGMLLVKNNLIDAEKLSIALDEKSGSLKKLGEILVEHGHITEKELKSALSMQAGVAPINLDPHLKVKMKDEIPRKIIDEFQFVLFDKDEKSRVISMAVYDMDYLTCLEDYFAQICPGFLVKFYLEDRPKVTEILSRNYPKAEIAPDTGVTFDKSVNIKDEGAGMEKVVMDFADFLHRMTDEEIKVDNLDRAVWIKSETKDFKIDIYLTKK